MVAPSSLSQATPFRQSASISGAMPGTRYSLGMPMVSPFTPLPTAASKSGTSTSTLVASFVGPPHLEQDRSVLHGAGDQSSLVEDEANATMPNASNPQSA
jgi:hypothetical protein